MHITANQIIEIGTHLLLISTNMADNAENEKKILSFPGKACSDVWNFFGFYENNDKKGKCDTNKVVCRKCKKEYVYNGM